MPPELKISQNVINRLEKVKDTHTGNIYGILHNNTLLIIGFHIHDDQKTELIHGFPTEVDMYGVLDVADGVLNEERVKFALESIDVTDTPVYMTSKINVNGNIIEAYYNVNNQYEKVKFETVSESYIYSQFLHIRLITHLPFVSGVSVDAIKKSFNALRKQLGHGQIVFNFPKTSIYMMDNHDALNGLTNPNINPSVGEICKEILDVSDECLPSLKKKKALPVDLDVIKVVMLRKATRDFSADNIKSHAPVVHIEKRPNEILTLSINIDALSIAHRGTKVAELYAMLVESCCRNLRLLEAQVINNFEECNGEYARMSEPETFHFFPELCGHFITKAYTKRGSDVSLEKERILLHKQLLLPLNKPVFRRTNRYMFKEDMENNRPLLNPHEGLHLLGNGGEVALVRGKYRYYHYCQDKMDDNGWGCAYRSLQTLASWFLLQGYTEKPVPTFKDIQKCLVDIGDKPSNFVGSKQWIGSTEVNFVLNSLLDVTCKILYVSSGEDMASKGPELLHHFQVHGAPVMIGGGVLAHTILGVEYDRASANIKFLILDPHYTGSEDLAVIQKKGWCGWKGVNFWDKTAYYNMCLPQVPSCI